MSDSPYAFDAPDADVIIRAPLQQGSNELKDFHVHKVILSIAATFFRDMFSIPQPPQPTESDTTLPIIQIAESAGVFETFLRLIYPIEPPVIDSLQLVDHLFQLAEKYLATGVRARLKQILLSPSFLNNDPILVYAIAYRMNLDKEARLAIPHTFEIDLIQDIPRNTLRMMTGEAYNLLLVEHSLRRDQLVNAVDEVCLSRGGQVERCRCAGQLKKEMRLQISGKPFLDREMVEKCFSFAQAPPSTCRATCLLSSGRVGFITDFMRRILEI